MGWMNEYDVRDEADFWFGHPVMGPATETLANLVEVVNGNSDGWPYWKAPAKAAAKLMALIEQADSRTGAGWEGVPTAAEIRKAYTPIKAFLTRKGLTMEVVAV